MYHFPAWTCSLTSYNQVQNLYHAQLVHISTSFWFLFLSHLLTLPWCIPSIFTSWDPGSWWSVYILEEELVFSFISFLRFKLRYHYSKEAFWTSVTPNKFLLIFPIVFSLYPLAHLKFPTLFVCLFIVCICNFPKSLVSSRAIFNTKSQNLTCRSCSL